MLTHWTRLNIRLNLTKFCLLTTGVLGSLLVLAWIAPPAQADCVYEGQTYPTGSRVGPYMCMPDGTWQPQ